jgi:hypothetical protein
MISTIIVITFEFNIIIRIEGEIILYRELFGGEGKEGVIY